MGQALYRKWRPQTFDDIVGQQHIVQTLRNALQVGHIHHAYLLAGPRGTGKTTTARLIAKAVNCLAPPEERPCNECEICRAVGEGRLMDLIEIDAASNTGVDNIREILEKVGFRPTQATYKVYVIDEVHMLSTAAFNALLKTLEEPPEHVIFVLATTEAHKIPATVLSRCQRFEFQRIPLKGIVTQLQSISNAEGYQTEPEALDLIARAATGSMRDAISLLDQMAAESTVTADYVRLMLGAERREVVRALAESWIAKDIQKGLENINNAIDGGADPRQLARQVADFLRGLLLMRLGTGNMWTDPTDEERPQLVELANHTEVPHLVEAIRRFSEVASQRHTGWQPQLPLELAFVEATMEPLPAPTPVPAPQPQEHKRVPRVEQRAEKPYTAIEETKATNPALPPVAQQVTERHASTPEPRQPATTPREETSPAAATATDIPWQEMDQKWRSILQDMRRVDNLRSVAALLHSAHPAGVSQDGKLILSFKHAFHRNKVNADDNRHAVEQFLSAMVNSQINVHCVLEKDLPSALAASPVRVARKKDKPAEISPTPPEPVAMPDPPEEPPVESWENDELIRRAKEELGAVPKIKE